MTASSDHSSRRGRPAGREGRELLDVAREVFTTRGFRGATMDAVAAAAHVSKQSLYAAHPSKGALYAAVVSDWVDRGRDALAPHAEELERCTEARDALMRFVSVLQAGLLSEPVLRVRALVAAESTEFPEVAADYLQRSWTHNLKRLAQALAVLNDRGVLIVDAPDVAAEQLVWLAVGAPLNELILRGGIAGPDPERLTAAASDAVTTFLSRYAPAR